MRLLPVTLVLAAIAAGLPARHAGAGTISYVFGTQGCGQVTTSTGTCGSGATLMTWQAFGDPTTLKLALTYAAVNNGGSPGLDSTVVGGIVTVSDLITLTGGTLGSAGTLQANWHIDGTLTASGSADLTLADFGSQTWMACGSSNTHCSGFSAQANDTVSLLIPFVFGTPFVTAFSLHGSTSGGDVAFYNTAELQPFLVFDASGAPVTGAAAVGDDGFQYAVGAPAIAAVPEPSSMFLVAGGAALLLRRRAAKSKA